MMSALGWIVSIVGVVGIGGFIALVIFAPLLAQGIIKIFFAILKSILSTRIGVGLLVGAVCLVGGYFAGDLAGAAREEAKCESAALNARIAELKVQLKNATDRANSAAAVISDLQAADVAASGREEALRREVAAAKLQSTKPGAKVDAKAILDDRCLLTERGARRMLGK